MEVKLKKKIELYDKASGDYLPQDKVEIIYTGKKGLKALKRLQDIIYTSFSSQAKRENADGDKQDDKIVTVDELFDGLEMTGQSEKLFDEVCGTLKAFATIGEKKLDDVLQDQIQHEDLEKIYESVLKHFLLPKICQKMNSMSK